MQIGRQFVAKKALFSFMGSTFRVFDPQGSLQFFIKQKAFKLKEELNVFADENQTKKRLTIKARSWSDFSAAYDVVDVETGETVGACKREGMKSMFRDSWLVMAAGDEVIGKCEEDSMLMAMLRRLIFKQWLPQKFTVKDASGNSLGTIRQRFNPFQIAYDVNFEGGGNNALDSRLGIALVVLLLAIEGRQQ